VGLIGQEQNGVYAQYHFDSRGSTVALTDSSGNVTDRFEYGPYAETISHAGTSDTPFQFNGQYGVQTDPNGLLYMRARYYNPTIRRFINQDVLFGAINPGVSLNRFAFANGNPVSLMDPFGLCAANNNVVANTANFFGAWDDRIINSGITALQWIMTFGGEADAANALDGGRNFFANGGFYDPNSAVARGGTNTADNFTADLSLLFLKNPAAAEVEKKRQNES
jgi:RHS repeat-associated protein